MLYSRATYTQADNTLCFGDWVRYDSCPMDGFRAKLFGLQRNLPGVFKQLVGQHALRQQFCQFGPIGKTSCSYSLSVIMLLFLIAQSFPVPRCDMVPCKRHAILHLFSHNYSTFMVERICRFGLVVHQPGSFHRYTNMAGVTLSFCTHRVSEEKNHLNPVLTRYRPCPF